MKFSGRTRLATKQARRLCRKDDAGVLEGIRRTGGLMWDREDAGVGKGEGLWESTKVGAVVLCFQVRGVVVNQEWAATAREGTKWA